MDAYLKYIYIYIYIYVLLISGSPQLEILGPSLISCEDNVAIITIHHLRYCEKNCVCSISYLICDFYVYLKCIPYSYMISLKYGDEEENS